MGKSVYSIVLNDDVVRAIDELAYSSGTSRSGLINQILAEHLSFTTPEMRIRDIFSQVCELLDSRFLTASQASPGMLALKAQLHYKYRPTVRYSVELFRDLSGRVGRLKVTMRTQSEEITSLSLAFYSYWSRLEKNYLGHLFKDGFPCEVSQKGYVRDFFEIKDGELTDEEIARSISGYIGIFDKAIAAYFENASDKARAENECKKIYRKYLEQGVSLI